MEYRIYGDGDGFASFSAATDQKALVIAAQTGMYCAVRVYRDAELVGEVYPFYATAAAQARADQCKAYAGLAADRPMRARGERE